MSSPRVECFVKKLTWFKRGKRVQIKRLKNAKELNEKTGEIVRAAELDVADGSLRVGVKLDDSDRVVSIKTDNLDLLLWWIKRGTRVRLKLLKNANELNGKFGVVVTKAAEVVLADSCLRVGVKLDDSSRVMAVKTKYLDVMWDMPKRSNYTNDEKELCPVCPNTVLINHEASFFECCGGRICRECFEKQIFEGDPDTCPLCHADMTDTSEAAAVVRIRTRANQGDPNALYNLGGIYDGGLYGVEQDQVKARYYYRLAAEGGEVRGAQNLACSYRDGEGGPVDLVQAYTYFRMAAEGGHLQGITNLGLAYLHGDGVKQDIHESVKWLKLGAERGDLLAQQKLANMADFDTA